MIDALNQTVADRIAAERQRKRLPILCLDFDGVLHGYQSGWQGAAVIPDLPVPGAVEFLHGAVERFRVAVYSSRSNQPGGIDAMRGWLTMHVMATIEDRCEAAHVLGLIEWPTEKPPAVVTLDDRAITFTGAWPSLDEIAAFKPWNKRPEQPGGPAEAAENRDVRQDQVRDWVVRCWGEGAVGVNERVERFFEEAAELAQAEGIPSGRLAEIILHVYQKEAGEPAQEVGGIGTTLLAYCAAKGISADECERRELSRILAKPVEHFRARHAAKVQSGLAQDLTSGGDRG